jgi:fumarylacetoacetase
MRVGDLLGSGTISGSYFNSYGSMLELSWKGDKDVILNEVDTGGDNNSSLSLQSDIETEPKFKRKFLNDFDTVIMKGCSSSGSYRIGFGTVIGKILPSNISQILKIT